MSLPIDAMRVIRRCFAPLCLLVLCTADIAFAHDAPMAVADQAHHSQSPRRYEGTIRDLVVEDRLDGRVFHFPRLELAAGGSVALLNGPVVDLLRAGDRVALNGRLNGKALQVDILESHVQSLAPDGKRLGKHVTGRFEVLHADDFDNGASRFSYHVRADDDTITELVIDALPAVLRGGMRIEVDGHDEAAGLVPDHVAIVQDAPEPTRLDSSTFAKSATVHKVLVVMANFNNTAAPTFTAAQAQQVMTSNTNSVANFYNEASFGQHQLNVTVTSSWLTLNYAKPTCVDADLGGFTNAANAAANAAGYVVSNYDFVVYVFPPLSCGWSGLGYIGAPRYAYINGPGSFATSVVGHEMGHNFGLLHAGSLRCTGSVGGACSVAEYGDPFDVMGNQHAGHFNAVQKSLLGWIGPGTTPTHGGGTATYTLSPIEAGGGSTYAVKVPTPLSSRTYWLEYRQPIGFDNWGAWVSNGVQIRLESPFETYCSGCDAWSEDTELVDATPGTSSFTDAALTVGSSFTDPNYSVAFNVLSATPSAVTVQVVTPAVVGSTTTVLSSSLNPAPVGAAVTFTATVSGSAPTGTVAFKDGGSGISGCSARALAGSGNTRTATCTTSGFAAGSHGITATYSGDASNAASTSTVVTETVNSGSWLGFLSGGNIASGSGSAVAAGSGNIASGQGSFVGAGTANSADGVSSLVIGGFDNHATTTDAIVGAGAGNRATGARSVVVGGGYNLAAGNWSFIGGGGRQTGSGTAGSSAQDNVALAKWSTVLGGMGNRAGSASSQTGATVGGGEQNSALNTDSTVSGGTLNQASAVNARVGGGQSNTATASSANVGGGSANAASGIGASVPGGSANASSGNYAIALGQRAKSVNAGAFAFADGSAFDFATTATNQFAMRATGGVRFVTAVNGSGAPAAGVALGAGSGTWSNLSDRNAKRDLTPVDDAALLQRLDAMPMYRWRYNAEPSGALHLGPVAQDFHTAFGLGDSDRRIVDVDASGVALAALKALQARVAQREALIGKRARQLDALRARVQDLEAALRDAAASLRATARTRDPYAVVNAIYPTP